MSPTAAIRTACADAAGAAVETHAETTSTAADTANASILRTTTSLPPGLWKGDASRALAPGRYAGRLGQTQQRDRGEQASRGRDRGGVPDLVEPERAREGVGPLGDQHQRADRVEDAAGDQEAELEPRQRPDQGGQEGDRGPAQPEVEEPGEHVEVGS